MSTALKRFAEPLRVVLGQRFHRDEATRLEALRLVLRMGRVPGHTLTPDELSVTPDLNPPVAGTPLAYLQLLHRAALLIACPDAGSSGFDTRAYRSRLGEAWSFIQETQRVLWEAERDAAAAPTWQSVAALLRGVDGLAEIFEERAPATTTGNFPGLNFSASGVTQS